MRDKQYFTVEDLDSAHRAGVAYGITNSGNSSRVERALELIRNKQSGTKVADSKAKDASKLLLGLGLSGAAIAAATGGRRKGNDGSDSSSDASEISSSSSTTYNRGKAGTELPLGLTVGKDGTAAPAIDGKVASMLGLVGKMATKVNPAIGIGITLLTSLLSKDLTGKADEFNKKEEEKFKSLLGEKDKDFTDYATLQSLVGASDTLNTDATSTIMNTPEPSGESADSNPSYTGSTY